MEKNTAPPGHPQTKTWRMRIVVVLRVCSDSWRSNRGSSRQELLSRSGLPLPSPEFISHLCVPCSESIPPPACAIFSYLALLLLKHPNVGRWLPSMLDTSGYRHTLRICKTHLFCTATMVVYEGA